MADKVITVKAVGIWDGELLADISTYGKGGIWGNRDYARSATFMVVSQPLQEVVDLTITLKVGK
jgi:hypothetical protein